MAVKQKKGRSAARTVLIGTVSVLCALAALYVAVQLYTILHKTYRTETAIQYTMADSIYLDGVASFEAVEVPGSGNLGYLVEDGQRVTSGAVLAEQYTDESQAMLREQLTTLESEISLLEKSQNSTGSDLAVLTAQTTAALYDLLDELETAGYGGARAAGQEFLLAQNRLQVSTGQAQDFSATLAGLTARREELAAQLGQLAAVTAPTNGYFICAQNAGAAPAAGDVLENASPAELEAILQAGGGEQPQGTAGRIVTGFTWYFYAVCSADDAARFKPGSSVKLSVPGRVDTPLAAAVDSVQVDAETGLAKLRLTCQSVNAEVLSLGTARARIDLHTYEGIRIDKNALHIVDGENGVYVKYGNLQRFRRITKLYEDENYILVPEGGALGTENEVRLYDEIIVEGNNLQDGKLM